MFNHYRLIFCLLFIFISTEISSLDIYDRKMISEIKCVMNLFPEDQLNANVVKEKYEEALKHLCYQIHADKNNPSGLHHKNLTILLKRRVLYLKIIYLRLKGMSWRMSKKEFIERFSLSKNYLELMKKEMNDLIKARVQLINRAEKYN